MSNYKPLCRLFFRTLENRIVFDAASAALFDDFSLHEEDSSTPAPRSFAVGALPYSLHIPDVPHPLLSYVDELSSDYSPQKWSSEPPAKDRNNSDIRVISVLEDRPILRKGGGGVLLDSDLKKHDIRRDQISVDQIHVYQSGKTFSPDDSIYNPIGNLKINKNGVIDFLPYANQFGSIFFRCDLSHSYDYIRDFVNRNGSLEGLYDKTDWIELKVLPVNDAPFARNDLIEGLSHTPVFMPDKRGLLFNDIDFDGDDISIARFRVAGKSYEAGQTAILKQNEKNVGHIIIHSDGSYNFAPLDPEFEGTVSGISYIVSDGKLESEAKVSILIEKRLFSISEDSSIRLDESKGVFSDDYLKRLGLSRQDVSVNRIYIQNSTGQIVSVRVGRNTDIPEVGSLKVQEDGSIDFFPEKNKSGSFLLYCRLKYHMSDPERDVGNLFIDYKGNRDYLKNLVPYNPSFDFNQLESEKNRVLSTFYAQESQLSSFPYYTQFQEIRVTPVDDAPVAGNDALTLTHEAAVFNSAEKGLLSNDNDPEGNLLFLIRFQVNGQWHGAGDTVTLQEKGKDIARLTIRSDGSYDLFPLDSTFVGALPKVNYVVSDGKLESEGKASINIKNRRVDIIEDSNLTLESWNGLITNYDLERYSLRREDLSVKNVGYRDTISGAILSSDLSKPIDFSGIGSLQVNRDGSLNFSSYKDAHGSIAFEYEVVSKGAALFHRVQEINVLPGNDAPIANGNSLVVTYIPSEPEFSDKGFLDNDKDIDGDNLLLTQFKVDGQWYKAGEIVTLLKDTFSAEITVRSDGKLRILSSDRRFHGEFSIPYMVSDGQVEVEGTASVSITSEIIATNDECVIARYPVFVSAREGLLVNDGSGLDTDKLSINRLEIGDLFYATGQTIILKKGDQDIVRVIIRSDGSYDLIPLNTLDSTFDINYVVTDGKLEKTAKFQVIVREDLIETLEDVPLNVPKEKGFITDHDLKKFGFVREKTVLYRPNIKVYKKIPLGKETQIPGVGRITIQSDGSYNFSPDANFSGSFKFLGYSLKSEGKTSFAGFKEIKVLPVNDAPIAMLDRFELNMAKNKETILVPVEDGLLSNDRDVDNDKLVLTEFYANGLSYKAGETATLKASSKKIANITINSDGSYVFVPLKYSFEDPIPHISYMVSDGEYSSAGKLIIHNKSGVSADSNENHLSRVKVFPILNDKNRGYVAALNALLKEKIFLNLKAGDSHTISKADGLLGGHRKLMDASSIIRFRVKGIKGSFSAGTTVTVPGVGDVVVNKDGSVSCSSLPGASSFPLITYVSNVMKKGWLKINLSK